MALSRDEIITAIAARKVDVSPLEVPEWGGTVYLRRLDAEDLDRTGLLDGAPEGGTARMAIDLMLTCITDEGGKPLFTDGDRGMLAGTEFPVVLRVFGEIAKVNGLSSEGLDEAMSSFAAAQPDASSSS